MVSCNGTLFAVLRQDLPTPKWQDISTEKNDHLYPNVGGFPMFSPHLQTETHLKYPKMPFVAGLPQQGGSWHHGSSM